MTATGTRASTVGTGGITVSDLKPHPAKFSEPIVEVIRDLGVLRSWRALDPFAGVGGVHQIHPNAIGVEIEPEWALQHPRNIVGDAHHLPFTDDSFDIVITSPVYGNRMSDHFEAKDSSKRITYRHTLGRPVSENSSGKLQWGEKYRHFHEVAWREAARVLGPGGAMVLNVSDHIRKGERQRVVDWHVGCLESVGFKIIRRIKVPTRRMGFGENSKARVEAEEVVVGILIASKVTGRVQGHG